MSSITEWLRTHKISCFQLLRILISLPIGIFILVDDIQSYVEYQNRPNYQLFALNKTNSAANSTSTTYYMVRENATIANCSSKAAFRENITNIYYIIVTKASSNYVYLGIFWFNIAIAIFLLLTDISEFISTCCEKSSPTCSTFLITVFDDMIKNVWLFATLIAPSYYISVFDYTETCLTLSSGADFIAATYVAVAIAFPIIGFIGICCVHGCVCYAESGRICSWQVYNTVKAICKSNTTKKKLCLLCFTCHMCYTFFVLLAAGIFFLRLNDYSCCY